MARQALPGSVSPITSQGVEPTLFTALRARTCAVEIPPKTCLHPPYQMSTHCLPHQHLSLPPTVWALMRRPSAFSPGTRHSHLVTVFREEKGRENGGERIGADRAEGQGKAEVTALRSGWLEFSS